MRMLTAARGAVPGLAPGKLNVEYVAMDGTLHAVPLANAARVGLTDMQPSRRFKARKGQRNLPGRWWSATDARHVGYESWLERDLLRTMQAELQGWHAPKQVTDTARASRADCG
jgi:hypothetical protein